MKLTFLGTRGYIDPRSTHHGMHSSMMVAYRGNEVMIDCGEDWLGRLGEVKPQAIVITHAHPDHAFGLRQGAPCPVWATAETWERLEGFPISEKQIINPRQPAEVRGILLEAFPVQHSIRAPAVGYRITAGRVTIFYAPDLVYIEDRASALAGCSVYIGDGATVRRSMVRKEGDRLFGHTPVMTQLTWCRKEGVGKMIVTHCGSEIVSGGTGTLDEIRELARERGVEVEVARDGMELVLK